MRLRNKKTGEIKAFHYLHPTIPEGSVLLGIWNDGEVESFTYKSLADFCEEWEDCNKPAEPLIKDEKIRKAVRAWAEINSIEKVSYAARLYKSSCLITDMDCDQYSIEFVGWIPTLDDGKIYTIAELCGEGEE